jgi:cytochrome c peroxidase
MDHYNKGDGITNPWLDKDMQPLALTEAEIDDVVAFLGKRHANPLWAPA